MQQRIINALKLLIIFNIVLPNSSTILRSTNKRIVDNGGVEIDLKKACDSLNCNKDNEICMKRKLSCDYLRCPSLIYCTKRRIRRINQSDLSANIKEEDSIDNRNETLNCDRNFLIRGTSGENYVKNSVYRTPVYVRSNSIRNLTNEGFNRVCEDDEKERNDSSSINEWLDNLRLRTGVDAVNAWAKYIENDDNNEDGNNYRIFHEWLQSVKSTLGFNRFGKWFTEFQKSLSVYPVFRKWLSVNGNRTNFYDDDKSVTEYREISTSKPSIFDNLDNDYLLVSQPDLKRKNAGHPRINYRFNPIDDGYEKTRRGYIKSVENLTQDDRSIIDNEKRNNYDDVINETIVKEFGNHSLDRNLESGFQRENNSNDRYGIFDIGDRKSFDRRTNENSTKFSYTLSDNDYEEKNSTLDLSLKSFDKSVINDSEKNSDIRENFKIEDLPSPIFTIVDKKFEIINDPSIDLDKGKKILYPALKNINFNGNIDNETKKGDNIISEVEKIIVKAASNSSPIFEPEKKIYYAIFKIPEKSEKGLEFIGYPLIVTRNSAEDKSAILSSFIPNTESDDRKFLKNYEIFNDSFKEIFQKEYYARDEKLETEIGSIGLEKRVENFLKNEKNFNDEIVEDKIPVLNRYRESFDKKIILNEENKEYPLYFETGDNDYPYVGFPESFNGIHKSEKSGSSIISDNHYSRASELKNRLKSSNKLIGKYNRNDFENYLNDLEIQEYFDSYLNAFVEDAVLKLLFGNSLKNFQTSYDSTKKFIEHNNEDNNNDNLFKFEDKKIEIDLKDRSNLEIGNREIEDDLINVDGGKKNLETIGERRIESSIKSPLVIGIDYQLYDCEDNDDKKNVQESRIVDKIKNLPIEDRYEPILKAYEQKEEEEEGEEDYYYYEDEEIQFDYAFEEVKK